ncbi:MAG TPA: [FeFe] hydrogenase H-cluster radical SAM maturase HydE [Candidatus Omnitrophota bacterium]|nr:[FeFe] hydrogenase H-cluster radical SAM maturase HydE [Candidatus Omnitrophota bacterium]
MSKAESLINKISSSDTPEDADLKKVLSFTDDEDVRALFACADKTRREHCGEGIALRGLIEFSNVCERDCFYCGLNRENRSASRYRMTEEEISRSVKTITSYNIKTIVLQSGEDHSMKAEWLRDVIISIKSKFEVAVTLSVGERSADDYKMWRAAGADRYLLKIEAYDDSLYRSAHLRSDNPPRLRCLAILRDLGYQVGTGNIVGLPGQTLDAIGRDIAFFKKGDFDMVSISPFIPHAGTSFGSEKKGDVSLTLKTMALARIVTKNAYIPATTALGSLDRDYREEGLNCGANVLMPNFTPMEYRDMYEIYPGKVCLKDAPGSCAILNNGAIERMDRRIDYGRCDSLKSRGLSNV